MSFDLGDEKFSPFYIVLFFAFVLPGAITMYFYGLKFPQATKDLKDKIPEAVCYSLINFLLAIRLILPLFDTAFLSRDPCRYWLDAVTAFIILPAVWPFLFVYVLRILEWAKFIKIKAPTGWDHFFSRRKKGAWVVAQLQDGQFVGGVYGAKSFASAWPDPDHLYIEQLWEVDAGGLFTGRPLPAKYGIVLRPTDYKYIRVLEGG